MGPGGKFGRRLQNLGLAYKFGRGRKIWALARKLGCDKKSWVENFRYGRNSQKPLAEESFILSSETHSNLHYFISVLDVLYPVNITYIAPFYNILTKWNLESKNEILNYCIHALLSSFEYKTRGFYSII